MTTSLDPDRWARAEEIFGRALEAAPDEREALVAEACGDDRALEEEILRLLSALASATDYFSDVAEKAGIRTRERIEPETLVGRMVGPYHLERLLGRGGMGAVFLARRADHQFEKEVALKLLPWGFTTPEAVRRFRGERHILARLEDPRIARILDGGTTDDGTPYFVMEYVQGTPIDQYCDAHRLGVRHRLALFLEVCDAVEYAHRHFVVHQDLKPANILVTEDGSVKLLDFGIARILDPDGSRDLAPEPGQTRPLTPAYASPEQVSSDPITTASDVYTLGILLYELLTGEHPYRHEFGSPAEVARVICEVEPTEPSRRVAGEEAAARQSDAEARATSPSKLQRELSGDLDAIVLAALQKEPGKRYRSVHHLSDDVRRHLRSYPVQARSGSHAYRVSRFIQRHRVGFGATVALVVLATALLGLTLRHNRITARMGQALVQEAQTTQEVSDFLVDLFRVPDPEAESGETVLARTLLDQGVERLAGDTQGPPEVRAQTLTVLAQVYDNLGLHDEAVRLLEEGLRVRQELHGEVHPEVAEALESLAGYSERARKPVVALGYYEQALATRRALGGAPLQEANALQGMGRLLRDQGAPDSAEVLIRQALDIRRAARGDGDLETVLASLDLAYVLRRTGAADSAQLLYEQAIEGLRAHGDSGATHLPAALNNLAFLHRTQGRNDRAEALYREALVLEEAWGTVPNLLLLMNNLAAVLDEEGRAEEADQILAQGIRTAEGHWPNGHWRVGSAYGARGALHLLGDDPARAEPFLRQALEIAVQTLTEDSPRTAFAHMQYGICLEGMDRYPEAEGHLMQAFDWFRGDAGVESPRAQEAAAHLVDLHEAWGRPALAERFREMLVGR